MITLEYGLFEDFKNIGVISTIWIFIDTLETKL